MSARRLASPAMRFNVVNEARGLKFALFGETKNKVQCKLFLCCSINLAISDSVQVKYTNVLPLE
jgi:hypothetical protein